MEKESTAKNNLENFGFRARLQNPLEITVEARIKVENDDLALRYLSIQNDQQIIVKNSDCI